MIRMRLPKRFNWEEFWVLFLVLFLFSILMIGISYLGYDYGESKKDEERYRQFYHYVQSTREPLFNEIVEELRNRDGKESISKEGSGEDL